MQFRVKESFPSEGSLTIFALSDSRDALIRVGHWARARKIEVLLLGDVESCVFNEVIYLAVEMATTSNPLPKWRYAILPGRDSGICRTPMFDEDEATVPFSYSLHLLKGCSRIRYGA